MSFLLLVRKLACRFAVAIPLVVSAQSGFAPLGGEYAIVGALPGDQVMPAISIKGGGGYVVWQDNATDGDGWGISGRALNGALAGAGSSFRINSTSKWDQENPQAALLNNGGAVFVWQGGRHGFQHIYARFLSASNTWLSLDQMVNASAKTYQAHPAVAVMNNGNVVIVYVNYNAATMQDVYGQIFSPTGQKVGGEFQLNQFTPYNQRSPSVAALNTGGFVAAWVSEQQRTVAVASSAAVAPSLLSYPSVDIYARRFDAVGNAAIAEFPINASSNVCANPVVAAAADGSVMFAWSERDMQVLNNSWDIYARPFTFPSSLSYVPGVEQRVNTQLYGDQYAPQIASQGNNHLIVWTSLGQDGSAAGVFGQILNADGSRSGNEFRVNSSTMGAQKEPALATDQSGRFLTAWTSPTFSPRANDLFAQIYAGDGFTPPSAATNYFAPIFVGDPPAQNNLSGSATNIPGPFMEPPTLDYPGVLASGGGSAPATNAFALAAGKYNGLFYEAAGVSPASSGSFSATTTAGKGYRVKLKLGGKSYPTLNGSFDDLGSSGTKFISGAGLPTVTMNLQLDLFGGGQITGQIKSGGWNAALVADHQTAGTAAQYTMALPGKGNGAITPAGSGYATINVSASGVVAVAGALADKTPFTTESTLSKSGVWPLYVVKGGSIVMGWVQLAANSGTNVNGAVTGDVAWFKPASAAAACYKSGFTNETSLAGAVFAPPVSGTDQLTLSLAGIGQGLAYSLQLSSNWQIIPGANLQSFVPVKSGLMAGSFTGRALIPGTTKTLSFQGVLLGGGAGAGFFMNTNKQSGVVSLVQP